MFLAVIGIILLIVNGLLVYFIRGPRTFGVFPGIVFLVLFLSFGAYMIVTIAGLKPDVSIGKNGKEVSSGILSEGKAMTLPEEKARRNMESLAMTADFLALMLIQDFFALVAAVIGWKVVKVERNYYTGFASLYIALFLLISAASYIVHTRIV
ncbi:MAG: hypothetical protein ACHQRM_01305 [Bacteroidia bacterium]